MRQKAATVDEFIESGCGRCDKAGTPECKVHNWLEIVLRLRQLLQQTELDEAAKWGAPCYGFKGKNLIMIAVFKDYSAISFLEGSFLDDPEGLLEKPGENVRHGRVVKFNSIAEFEQRQAAVEDFIQQAISNAKQGKQVIYDPNDLPDYCDELVKTFELDPDYQDAFLALTPGRQRGYLLHFNQAKQAATRSNRIAKVRDKVMAGKGMQDR
ncbi:YdeI/OmpD-associated family protein [Salinibius halmophilus]|uniref:YdeI/OmpD-associated family protein n=1 Tax=Salinibius halmophilus TaxID=1853216 RepID=UPI000E669439|nr:YdeI/OmpD-associated family protein [Salinibius halmophilus]